MSTPSPPPDEGSTLSAPAISRVKERFFAPTRDELPPPDAGPVFGRRFFRLLRENTGGYFLLLFTGIGLGIFLLGLANLLGPAEEGESRLAGVAPLIIGIIFALGSLAMLQALLSQTVNRKRNGPRSQPWTWDHPWRTEWMAHEYGGGHKFALLARLAVIAVAILAIVAALDEGGGVTVTVAVGFSLVSLLLLYDLAKRFIQWLRLRRHPVVIWSAIPTFLGETLSGRIAYARPVRATGPARVMLRCVREEGFAGEGGQRPLLQTFAIYRETREVPPPADGPLESIDFAFQVPHDLPGNSLNAERPTYWQVVISVPLAGPDMETVFLAPVYQRAPVK